MKESGTLEKTQIENNPNTDVQVPMQKYKKREKPRQHDFSKVSNTSSNELDKIKDKKFKRILVSMFK